MSGYPSVQVLQLCVKHVGDWRLAAYKMMYHAHKINLLYGVFVCFISVCFSQFFLYCSCVHVMFTCIKAIGKSIVNIVKK